MIWKQLELAFLHAVKIYSGSWQIFTHLMWHLGNLLLFKLLFESGNHHLFNFASIQNLFFSKFLLFTISWIRWWRFWRATGWSWRSRTLSHFVRILVNLCPSHVTFRQSFPFQIPTQIRKSSSIQMKSSPIKMKKCPCFWVLLGAGGGESDA